MPEPMTVEVLVEIPRGCHNKYEVDPRTRTIRLDRTLFTATHYPADYGFVVDSMGTDGDPLDALVLLESPTFPGCRITARPVAVFITRDEAGDDPKLLCVPAGDPRWAAVRDLGDVAAHHLDEVAHFFAVYKQLEPGKTSEVRGWRGAEAARRVAEQALERARRPTSG